MIVIVKSGSAIVYFPHSAIKLIEHNPCTVHGVTYVLSRECSAVKAGGVNTWEGRHHTVARHPA